MAAIVKITARPSTQPPQQERIAEILAHYATSPELELQQRGVEFTSLYNLVQVREGVLERMPPPELKATVMGVGSYISFLLTASLITFAVSEKKPVGSTERNLLGDDVPQTPVVPALNGQAGAPVQSTQDLLADIFGSSSSESGVTPTPPAQKTTVDDIMGLFGNSSATASPAPSYSASPVVPSAFNLAQSQAPPAASPPPPQTVAQPPAQRLQSYTAYDKNDLKITLTPQASPNKPGLVLILARFQVGGSSPATGLTFQAAVPKVGSAFH